jgi:hypothetical protein
MIIANRTLKVRTSNSQLDVDVRLFKPVNEDGTWICKYEIDWPEGTKERYGAGADAIQAILLALKNVGAELYTSLYHKTRTLLWDSSGRGYGFPVAHNIRDLLIGDDLEL